MNLPSKRKWGYSLLVIIIVSSLFVGGAIGEHTSHHDPTVSDAGERTVIVQFDEQEVPNSSAEVSPNEVPTEPYGEAAVKQFVVDNPGVTIENKLSIANAVVVSINTDRVTPTQLRTIDGVASVEDNKNVQTVTTEQSASSETHSKNVTSNTKSEITTTDTDDQASNSPDESATSTPSDDGTIGTDPDGSLVQDLIDLLPW